MKLQYKYKKKLTRLLSATLASLTLITSVPLQSFADVSGKENVGGGTSDMKNATTYINWENFMNGYRFYLVDENLHRVTKIRDFYFENPLEYRKGFGVVNPSKLNFNTRFDSAGNIGFYTPESYTELAKLAKSTPEKVFATRAIYLSGGHGKEFRGWFLNESGDATIPDSLEAPEDVVYQSDRFVGLNHTITGKKGSQENPLSKFYGAFIQAGIDRAKPESGNMSLGLNVKNYKLVEYESMADSLRRTAENKNKGASWYGGQWIDTDDDGIGDRLITDEEAQLYKYGNAFAQARDLYYYKFYPNFSIDSGYTDPEDAFIHSEYYDDFKCVCYIIMHGIEDFKANSSFVDDTVESRLTYHIERGKLVTTYNSYGDRDLRMYVTDTVENLINDKSIINQFKEANKTIEQNYRIWQDEILAGQIYESLENSKHVENLLNAEGNTYDRNDITSQISRMVYEELHYLIQQDGSTKVNVGTDIKASLPEENILTKSIPLASSNINSPAYNLLKNKDFIQVKCTCGKGCENAYDLMKYEGAALMVEPITWIYMNKGGTTYDTEAEGRTYGTYYNLASEWAKNKGSNTGGMYRTLMSKLGYNCLYLSKDKSTRNGTTLYGNTGNDETVRSVSQAVSDMNSMMGISIHMYTIDDIIYDGTHTWDMENCGPEPGPAPDDKDEKSKDNANIIKFYESYEDGILSYKNSFTRTDTLQKIIIEDEEGYNVIDWYTSETFRSATGESPIYTSYKSSMGNVQTGSTASPEPITLDKDTSLYILLRKSDGEDVGFVLQESELTKHINLRRDLPERVWDSNHVMYTTNVLNACTGHCEGECEYGGNHPNNCTALCPSNCTAHNEDCPGSGGYCWETCSYEDVANGTCDHGKYYHNEALTDNHLDFRRTNSTKVNDYLALKGRFKETVNDMFWPRDNTTLKYNEEDIAFALGSFDCEYDYDFVLHRETKDKATICDYKVENGNSLAKDLFKSSDKENTYKARTFNGIDFGTMDITLVEDNPDKITVSTSDCGRQVEDIAKLYEAESSYYTANPTFNSAVTIKTYKGISRELENNPVGQYYYGYSGANTTSGIMIDSDTKIKFYPYIRMTVQNIFEDKQNVNVLSEWERIIQPVDYAEIAWTYTDSNLHLTSNQWSTHAGIRTYLTEELEGNLPGNSILPGGALYSLNTTNGREKNSQVITVNSYQTILTDTTRDISTIDGDASFDVNEAIEAHEDFANEVLSTLDSTTISQWVTTDTRAEHAWDSGIKVGPGSDITRLNNGSIKSSTDSKYYTQFDPENLQNVSRNDLDAKIEGKKTVYHRAYSDISGNIWYVKSDSLRGVDTTKGVIVLKQNQGVESLSGELANLNNKTRLFTNLINAIERNTGEDITAAWVDSLHWYNEAYHGITIIEQSSKIRVGFGVNYERIAILDPKLIPKQTSKHTSYDAFVTQYKTDLNPSAAVGTFKGTAIYMQKADLLYNSQKVWIPNMTVQDLS